MTAPNLNSLCEQASQYYYDVLSDCNLENIPNEALTHISQCPHCQIAIKQLNIALNSEEPDDQAQKEADDALAAVLELHYVYIGEPVACDHVKRFLPSLADPALEIRVPTPITAHIDNCTQCAEDLQTIRQLNLTHKQLCRLGQLFAEMPAADQAMCAETKKAVPFMARLDFQGLPADMLKHVCLCPDCRKSLDDKRQTERQRMQKQEQTRQFPCSDVLPHEIFDYAIPYGVDPQNDEYAVFSKSLVSHLATCPDCFGKLHDLHSAVFQILERPASGAVTKFHAGHSAKSGRDASSAYADWPVRVEVTHKAAVVNKLNKRFPAATLRPFIKPAAAAAVILFALLFYFNTQIARAVDLEQIYKAVAKISNVHITRFVQDKAEPTQEQWVSRTLNISIFKTPTELVLWDIPNSSKRVKTIAAGAVEVTSLSHDAAAGIKKNIDGLLGLLPFNDLSEIPHDAKWQPVTDIKSAAPDTMVYDLAWAEKSLEGSFKFKKWRVFVDTNANLPQRIELYQKAAADKEYVLESYSEVTYLSETQIQAVIRDAAF